MKVSREQSAKTRARIVEVAGTLFRAHGFDGVGVADIMKQAGLTHGGFYGHFDSKDALAAEAAATSSAVRRATWNPPAGPAAERLATFVRSYLSAEHRDDIANGCPMAALSADVAREPAAVRRAFTGAIRSRIDAMLDLLPGRNPAARRQRALATLAGVVGALSLARAVDDPALSDEFLAAAVATFAG